MDKQQILAKLTEIFRDIFDDDTLELTPDTEARDIADWDSANHINVIVSAEATFGIRFRSAEMEELKNVGEFVGLIHKHLAAAGR